MGIEDKARNSLHYRIAKYLTEADKRETPYLVQAGQVITINQMYGKQCPHANFDEYMDGSGQCVNCGQVKEGVEVAA